MHVSPSSLRSRLLSASLLLALATPMTAHALADDEARRAILELRQQLRQLTEQSQRAQLQLADQIDTLQMEVVRLRDQVEHASRPAPAAAKPAASGEENVADPQEQSAYDGALALFRNGQYQEAAEALNAFTVLYPSSKLAPLARFYQGSCLYAIKDFKGAIALLEESVKANPDSPRAADSLMMVAGSFIELQDYGNAKTTLQRVIRDYPGTPAADTAKQRLQLL